MSCHTSLIINPCMISASTLLLQTPTALLFFIKFTTTASTFRSTLIERLCIPMSRRRAPAPRTFITLMPYSGSCQRFTRFLIRVPAPRLLRSSPLLLLFSFSTRSAIHTIAAVQVVVPVGRAFKYLSRAYWTIRVPH